MKISYSFGILDLFHYGHLKALKEAASGADLHVVGLVSDSAAKAWLGNIVSNEAEREAVLRSISCVHWVMPQKTLDPTDNLRKLHYIYPDAEITLYRGDDTSTVVAREYLKSIGGRVVSLDYYEKLSPMEILNALNTRIEVTERHSDLVSTKANTLLAIKDKLKTASIEKIHVVSVKEVQENLKSAVDVIKQNFNGQKIVVRSSSTGEDCYETSNAGHYESILGVDSSNERAVAEAIECVYQSYAKDGNIALDEQILIQTQTEDVKYSGVVFTRDIQKNRPYYVINYDDAGVTDSVTSGGAGKVIWISQDATEESIPDRWKGLWASIKELEELLKGMLLDIEFAIKKDGKVVIFQVRPLAASYKFGRDVSVGRLLRHKNQIVSQYKEYVKKTENTFLSDMAFWNPAEIIGDNPDFLAYSLYKEIITHKAWSEGLVCMGYREISGDLMFRFGNKPYISLEKAFRCLIPAEISDLTAERLEQYYCKKLKEDLSAHDKIEFEIVFSCFDFSLEERIQELLKQKFSKDEIVKIQKALYHITDWSVQCYDSVLKEDMSALFRLEKKRKEIEEKVNITDSVQELARLVEQLLEAIKQNGTPQFSRQARFAFIAKALCLSLVDKGYWSRENYDGFMRTVDTVAGQFEAELKQFYKGEIDRQKFNEKYGHLRAGTYDICSPRYDDLDFEAIDERILNGKMNESYSKAESKRTEIKGEQESAIYTGIATALKENAISWNIEVLISFLRKSLEQREYFKFVFTRSLSRILEIIAEIGERLEVDRKTMSCLEIPEILGFSKYSDEDDIAEYVKEIFLVRKERRIEYSRVIMPNVIIKQEDFDFICPIDSRPNFITMKKTVGEAIVLDERSNKDIKGKIIIIEKADPGYDWIFSRGIAGLVTKYGGAASHMAIRCAEFDIPAAIGCGEKIFSYALDSVGKKLEIDCRKGIVKQIKNTEEHL